MATAAPSAEDTSLIARHAPGGSVEPANRAAVAVARYQTPAPEPGERFELRDPFAEVTYHARTLPEMAAKAEQLGSSRFIAVATEGKRTVVRQVEGRWEREEAAQPERASAPAAGPQPGPAAQARDQPEPRPEPRPDRSPAPPAGNVVNLNQAQTPAPAPGPVQPEPKPPAPQQDAVARIDAAAERIAEVARLRAALDERYLIKRTSVTIGDTTIGRNEYRYRGDTLRVAFTESVFKLSTDTNNPSVARSMVDLAQARQWKALRVTGNEEFKRLVWLEATVRGVKALGYEPTPTDLTLAQREREARQVNRIEPAREASVASPGPSPTTHPTTTQPNEAGAAKASGRGGGRKAVLAAIEAVLVAKGVPEARREAVMAAATEQLAQRQRQGQKPQVQVYDSTAPRQQPKVAPSPAEPQRQRERAAPAR